VSGLLRVEGLTAGYAGAVVVDEVSASVGEGEGVALLGRNGAGKTTLLMTLMGLTRRHAGTISWMGRDVTRARAHERAAAGIAWVPQERRVWPSLTVDEHLDAVARPGPWTPARARALFPRLDERRRHRGAMLSGGEQQMLAIARALVTNPRLMLLDEPMEGLAPILVQELAATLRGLVGDSGMAMVLVEQRAELALSLAARALVMERGRIVHEGASAALAASPASLDRWLAVG
jgi:branched-chain amino acid transport system ATP-binding protein